MKPNARGQEPCFPTHIRIAPDTRPDSFVPKSLLGHVCFDVGVTLSTKNPVLGWKYLRKCELGSGCGPPKQSAQPQSARFRLSRIDTHFSLHSSISLHIFLYNLVIASRHYVRPKIEGRFVMWVWRKGQVSEHLGCPKWWGTIVWPNLATYSSDPLVYGNLQVLASGCSTTNH